MNDMKFKNIFPDETCEDIFFKSYRRMSKHIGCCYMGYILEDTYNARRVGFTTNMEWGSEYIKNYINDCHLWRYVQDFFECSKYSSIILPWATLPPSKSIEKDIILRRREKYIDSDGISFCEKNKIFREYFYFAPALNDKNLVNYVAKNMNIVKHEMSIFRTNAFMLIENNNKRKFNEK